jgi:peptidyl-prolyl cis-trans isomerase D
MMHISITGIKLNLVGSCLLLAILVSGCVSVTPTAKPTASPTPQPDFIATVGDQTVPLPDFQTAVRFQRYQLIQQYNYYLNIFQSNTSDPYGLRTTLNSLSSMLTTPEQLGSRILNRIVEDMVITAECSRRAIGASNAEVDQAYQALFGYYPAGTPTAAPTQAPIAWPTLDATQQALVTLTPTTAQTATQAPPTAAAPTVAAPTPTVFTVGSFANMSDNFIANLQTIGVNEAYVRGLLKADILRQRLIEAVSQDMPTSQEQVWARHILVADKASADTVYGRLQNGEDFSQLAKEYSTDTATKNIGGDLGWFPKGSMVTEFENAAFALKVGEISQPVQTTYGWHIIQSLGHAVLPLNNTQLAAARTKVFDDWISNQIAGLKVTPIENWTQFIPSDPTFTPAVLP